MMNYISKFIFFMTLISSTFMVMSSSSWMSMWMGLELNLMSFIPLMIDTNNLSSTESAIKYFLIQAFASIIFLFSASLYVIKFSFSFPIFLNMENIFINISMMIKLGAAPLHFWFPNIIEGLTWMKTLILLTWQKLAPLTIISFTFYTNLINIFIISSALIGAIGGLNQTSLQKILVFSSINHMSWMLTAEFFNNFLWMFYFSIYMIINMSIIMMFKTLNLFFINQLFMFNKTQMIFKFCLLMNLFSLGGLPPFLGFLPKWLIIEISMKLNMFFLMFIIIMSTLITLFFYTRLTFSMFLLNYPSMKWNSLMMNFNKKNNLLIIIIFNIMNIYLLSLFMFINFF